MIDVLTHLANNHDNPYPRLDELRREDPVHLTAAGFYLVTRHADVEKLLRETGTAFLSPDRNEIERSFPAAVGHPTLELHLRSLLSRNPPEHRQLRRMVARALAARQDFATEVSLLCDELLDAITDELRSGEAVDLNHRFSLPLSLRVLAKLMGVQDRDRDWLAEAVNAIIPAFDGVSEQRLAAADRDTVRLMDYFGQSLVERGVTGRADLIGELVSSRGEFEDIDLVAVLWGLWTGGFLPVSAALNHAVRAMVAYPDRTTWLGGDEHRALAFTDEVLRHDGIVMFTAPPRIAVHDVTFGDRTVPAGAEVRGVLAAANRDPAAFSDPDTFRPGRDNHHSLAFSAGPHHCPASGIARLEVSTALSELHQRFPTLTIAEPPTWVASSRVSTIDSLRVRLKAHPSHD
ncbi:cytochrome P450 [Lentzea cavernae]|uniref:Cytochrome P450 BJ-3 n=1 Tax=Lentzea cavernae TaxID=2020703 RepID=A0ABQ3M3F5_9PSEU|nr:cytochrome P450 [Lentzea cavernae]GHH32315.1 cytochrome P450 BJ-3 [Lentzea cavernae]